MSSFSLNIKANIIELYDTLRSLDRRQLAHQLLTLVLIIASAVIIWKTLVVTSSSEAPVVVVLSGSMEPAFYRGDILILWMGNSPVFELGEIVVFRIKDRPVPIVHRIIEIHESNRYNTTTGSLEVDILTKGDNNSVDDRGLYNPGQLFIKQSDIMGKAVAFLPYFGMITITLTDYPAIKFIVIGLMALFVVTAKE